MLFIHCTNFCLLIGAFRPFSVTTDKIEFMSAVLLFFLMDLMSFVFLFSSILPSFVLVSSIPF